MRFTGCGAWDSRNPLGGSPTPRSSRSPLLTALLGCPAAGVVRPGCVEPPPAPADAVPPAGRRDGAQRHAPLQEEVRHHAALQAHLSWGLARPPTQDTKRHFVCTRWGHGTCVGTGRRLQPQTRRGRRARACWGRCHCPILLVWFDLSPGSHPPPAPLGFCESGAALLLTRTAFPRSRHGKGFTLPISSGLRGPRGRPGTVLSPGQQHRVLLLPWRGVCKATLLAGGPDCGAAPSSCSPASSSRPSAGFSAEAAGGREHQNAATLPCCQDSAAKD